jgi:hypothetical protein
VDPLFEVLTESASARLFDEAFNLWLQEQLADPREGLRRALRRTAFGGEDGPIDRLRKAAWDLAQWRDFTTAWTRPPFERQRQIEQALAEVHECAALTRHPTSTNDPLHVGTEPIRRLSDEITLQQSSGKTSTTTTGGKLSSIFPGSDPRKRKDGRRFTNGVARDRVLRRVSRSRPDSINSGWTRTPISPRYCRATFAARSISRRAEGEGRRVDFLDLLLGARSRARQRRRPSVQARSSGSSSTSFRTDPAGRNPAAARRTTTPRRIGDAQGRGLARCSLSAIPSSRFTVFEGLMWASIGGLRSARNAGRQTRAPEYELSRGPGDQACVNTRLNRSRPATHSPSAPYVALLRIHRSPTSRRLSRCRFPSR